MSTRAMLAMVAGIIAVHLIVLYLMIGGSPAAPAGGQTGEQAGENRIESGENRDADTESGGNKTPDVPVAVPGGTESAQPVRRHASGKRYSGRPAPLDGKNAVEGTIPTTNKKSILRVASAAMRAGILIDLDSRKILWRKNPDAVLSIASLSKMMTLILAYEAALPGGKHALDEQIEVTPEAQAVPPSGMALRKGEKFPYDKLLLAAAVKSANDAAYLLAQTIGGNEPKFAVMMNDRARELGMDKTTFFNSHGLPGKTGKLDNKSTARDIAVLSEAYLTYPELMKWSGTRIARFRTDGDLRNHNNLLPGGRTACAGVVGIKTGFTQRAGSCVAALCVRNNRRLLAVVIGCNGSRERDTFVRELFDWGFKR